MAALSSLSFHATPRLSIQFSPTCIKPSSFLLSKSFSLSTTVKFAPLRAKSDGIDTFFDNVDPEEEIFFDLPTPPEDFVPPPYFDEGPPETEEEIARAYEELYGPAYSGETLLGNDAYVMDSKVKKTSGFGSKSKKEKVKDGFDERVVQVRRVTKVVKGGKQLRFRAIVVVGDSKGQVGVGVGGSREADRLEEERLRQVQG